MVIIWLIIGVGVMLVNTSFDSCIAFLCMLLIILLSSREQESTVIIIGQVLSKECLHLGCLHLDLAKFKDWIDSILKEAEKDGWGQGCLWSQVVVFSNLVLPI